MEGAAPAGGGESGGPPPPPPPSSRGWKDITEECRRAAGSLEVGEMICGPDFSLFDAMSALELMDPKMDEAMQEPVESVASRLARGALPVRLPARQAGAVGARMLAYEAAWLEGGASFLDSFFLCLYPHAAALTALCTACGVQRAEASPEDSGSSSSSGGSSSGASVGVQMGPAEHGGLRITRRMVSKPRTAPGPILRDRISADPGAAPALALLALVLATLKSLHGFRKVVLDADIYEEEDCVPNSFGLYLAENLGEDDALFLLARAEEALASYSTETGKEEEDVGLLVSLLRFRARFLEVASALNSFAPARGREEGARIEERLAAAAAALGEVEAARGKLLYGKENEEEEAAVAAFAFDAGVTRPMKGNSPRRAIHTPTTGQALAALHKLLEDLRLGLGAFFFEAIPEAFSLQRLRMLLETYSLARDPGPVPRSFLHLHFLREEDVLLGRFSLQMALAEHMTGFGVPLSVSLSPSGQCFIHSVAKTVGDAMRCLLHNRARQRLRLEVLFQDLAVMQDNAAAMDEEFREAHALPEAAIRFFTHWIIEETLRSMQHYLQLGLELGLYSRGEADMVLWYLDCVFTIRLQVLQTMEARRAELEALEARMDRDRRLAQKQQQQQEKQQQSPSPPAKGPGGSKKGGGGGGGGKKKKGGGKGRKDGECEHEDHSAACCGEEHDSADTDAPLPPPEPRADDDALQETQVELSILRLLCRGTHLALTWLTRARGQAPPSPPHCPWADRFYHRFRAFEVLRHPELLTYQDFAANVWDPSVGVEAPLGQAKECFRAAKGLLDHGLKIKEHAGDGQGKVLLTALARVAVSNSVALAQAERSLASASQKQQQGPKVAVELSYSVHKQFPVLGIKVVEG